MPENGIIEPDWPAPKNIRAFCTTRAGGVSRPPYESLNLAAHVGDQPHLVQQNRQILGEVLQLPAWPVWLDQRHTRNVVCLDDVSGNAMPTGAADAAFSTSARRVCVVLTADCLPLLVCDESGRHVAAIHAGWRGLAAGIIEATIEAMVCDRPLIAWMGPAIGPNAYEIDEAVRRQLLAGDSQAQDAFIATRPGHWNADLYTLARRRLKLCGVNDVFGGNFCTYGDSEKFYSYRRDGECGRMASLIWRAE